MALNIIFPRLFMFSPVSSSSSSRISCAIFSIGCLSQRSFAAVSSPSSPIDRHQRRLLHHPRTTIVDLSRRENHERRRSISFYVTYDKSSNRSAGGGGGGPCLGSLKSTTSALHSSAIQRRDHVPDMRGTFPVMHPAPNLRLDTENEAEELCYFLKKSERELLYQVLKKHHRKSTTKTAAGLEEASEVEDEHFDLKQKEITRDQVRLLFLCNALPFIGFGILDNLIMILAGEYIDSTMGIVFGLSTMAAAGFGNIISDIAGVGSAHYVEFAVAKFLDVRPPPLTAEQWDSPKARWTTNSARALGLTIGCLIGMFPLLFYDEAGKLDKKLQAKQQLAANKSKNEEKTSSVVASSQESS